MARQLVAGFSAPAHQSSSLAMDALRARQAHGTTPNMREDGYSEPRTTTMVMPSTDVGSSAGLYSRSLKATAARHLLGASRSTVVEDSHSDTLIARAAALITRKANGTLPAMRDQAAFVLAEDTKDAVADAQKTRAYRSQAYSRTHAGVDTMASDSVLRDASKRMVGSNSSVAVFKAMTPGEEKKSFADLCRNVAINQSGYTPKAGDEKGWVDIHKGYAFNPLDADDEHFQGGTKTYDRSANRYGYDNDDSDADAEYVANGKGRDPKVATGERDDIYREAVEKFHAKLTYDMLPDEYDEEDLEEASDLAADLVEAFLDEEAVSEDKQEACVMAQFLANRHGRPFFVNKVTPYDEKGKKLEPIYHAASKKHYDNDDSRHWEYELTHIANPKPLKEDDEFKGRKLRQNLSKDEKDRLEKYGSVDFKSAGAKRKKEQVKEDDEQADRMNAMQGLKPHLLRRMEKSWTDDKMWTSSQFKYTGSFGSSG